MDEREKGKCVEVLNVINPHLFWVRVVDKNASTPIVYQAGLEKLIPISYQFFDSKWTFVPTDKWTDEAIDYFKEVLEDAQAVHFKVCSQQKSLRILESVPCVFGDITVKTSNGKLLSMIWSMTKNDHARSDKRPYFDMPQLTPMYLKKIKGLLSDNNEESKPTATVKVPLGNSTNTFDPFGKPTQMNKAKPELIKQFDAEVEYPPEKPVDPSRKPFTVKLYPNDANENDEFSKNKPEVLSSDGLQFNDLFEKVQIEENDDETKAVSIGNECFNPELLVDSDPEFEYDEERSSPKITSAFSEMLNDFKSPTNGLTRAINIPNLRLSLSPPREVVSPPAKPLLKRQSGLEILVHSNDPEGVEKWSDISESTFSKLVVSNLEKINLNMSKLFGKAWPIASKKRNLLVIGTKPNPAILVPLCSAILDEKQLGKQRKAVVFCPNFHYAKEVENFCNSLLEGSDVIVTMNEDLSSDITVVGPKPIKKLLSLSESLQEVSIVAVAYAHKFDEANLNFISTKLLKNHTLLIASQMWDSWLEKNALSLEYCTIIMEPNSECLVYGKAFLSGHLSLKEQKVEYLEYLLESNPLKKTIVCCSGEEVRLLHREGADEGLILISSDFTEVEMVSALDRWNSEEEVTLVCSDDALPFLGIFDARRLIHYSIPPNPLTFHTRFSLVSQNIRNLLAKDSTESDVEVDILFDEEDEKIIISKLIKLALRCGTSVPNALIHFVAFLDGVKESKVVSKYEPICNSLTTSGECSSKNSCTFRHYLHKEDKIPEHFLSNDVRFQIVKVVNPCRYVVKIMEYKTDEGVFQTTSDDDNFLSNLSLFKYVKMVKNLKTTNLFVGNQYLCINKSSAIPLKVQLLKIFNDGDNRVGVKHMETGRSFFANIEDLRYLSKQQCQSNSRTMTMRLAGMIPTEKIGYASLFEPTEGTFFRASVLFGFNNTVYVKSLQKCKSLGNSKAVVIEENTEAALLREEFIKPHNKQIKRLEPLMRYFDFHKCIKPVPDPLKRATPQEFQPQWAHLDEATNIVYCENVDYEGHFFVKLLNFVGLIEKNQKEIQTYVLNYKKEPESDWYLDDLCIAKFKDDLYYRAIVININDVRENIYECFFVDYGDYCYVSYADMYPITEELVNRLPFQVIECVMYGLRSPIPLNDLENYLLSPTEGTAPALFVKYFEKEKAKNTGGYRYSIAVMRNGDEQSVNRTLVIEHNAVLTSTLDSITDFETSFIESKKEVIENGKNDDDDFEPPPKKEDSPAEDDEWEGTNPVFDRPPVEEDAFQDDDNSSEPDIYAYGGILEMQKQICIASGIDPNIIPTETNENARPSSSSATITELVESPTALTPTKSDDSFEIINPTYLKISEKYNQLKKPMILWHQDVKEVVLKIQIPDMTVYKLSFNEQQIISFESTVNEEDYGFSFALASIVREEYTHHLAGNRVLVRFRKMIPMEWKRLTSSDVKWSWITYDFDYLDIPIDQVEDSFEVSEMSIDKMKNLSMHDDNSDDDDDDQVRISEDFEMKEED